MAPRLRAIASACLCALDLGGDPQDRKPLSAPDAPARLPSRAKSRDRCCEVGQLGSPALLAAARLDLGQMTGRRAGAVYTPVRKDLVDAQFREIPMRLPALPVRAA